MLKYTLGALAAFVILATTGLVILARVDDSNAGIGPAPQIIILMSENDLWPRDIELKTGEITEIRIDNQRDYEMALSVEGEGIEQLPELAGPHELGARDPTPYVRMQVSPGVSRSALVRFNEPGVYQARTFVPGLIGTADYIEITVK